MKPGRAFAIIAVSFLATILLLAACGGNGEADPTAEPSEGLSVTCPMTEILNVSPVQAFRGEGRVPTGFDSTNSAFCTFSEPIASVTVELSRQGEVIFEKTITLDPVSTDVGFPLPDDMVAIVPIKLETGRYDREITATSTDGETIKLEDAAGVIWVFDPTTSPETAVRKVLRAVRQALSQRLQVGFNTPSLKAFEPKEWSDASLGCPEPGMLYAQVITPGFRLLFEHTVETEVQSFEYHTNDSGSVVAFCELVE